MIDTHNTYALGQTLRFLRASRNITQKEVNAKLSRSVHLTKIENGVIEPKFQTIIEYLRIIGVSFEEFFSLYQNKLTTSSFDFSDHLKKNYGNISKQQFQKIMQACQFKNSEAISEYERMFYHKVCVFYHLHLHDDEVEAKKHAEIISDYLHYHVDFSLFSDIELSQALYPFVSADEAHFLFHQTKKILNEHSSDEAENLYLRSTLNYLKSLLHHRRFTEMLDYFDILDRLTKSQCCPIYIAEVKMLKAIAFTELSILSGDDNYDSGKKLIETALAYAEEQNLTIFYARWNEHCKTYQ